jgi:hypothetical protein
MPRVANTYVPPSYEFPSSLIANITEGLQGVFETRGSMSWVKEKGREKFIDVVCLLMLSAPPKLSRVLIKAQVLNEITRRLKCLNIKDEGQIGQMFGTACNTSVEHILLLPAVDHIDWRK